MKEIIDEIDSRIKNPFFGYFALSLIAVNWKELFYLVAGKSSVIERIAFFNNGTDIYSLFIYPFVFAAVYSIN